MKENLYLSVIGLSLSVINELKASLSELLQEQYHLNWTHLADSKLQVLLINEEFCESQLLDKISQDTRILKLKKNSNLNSCIQDNTLFLPLLDLTALKTWLQHVLHFKQKNLELNTTQCINPCETSVSWEIAEALAQEIMSTQSGKYVIRQADEVLAMLDFDEFRFYKNRDAIICGDVQFELASLSTVVDYRRHKKYQDLKHGIWLFFFEQKYSNTPILNQHYQIRYWPQLSEHSQRRDIYRMAALFMQGGCVRTAHQTLGLPIAFIEHFVLTSQLSSSVKNSEISTPNVQIPNSLNDGIRSIFHKLRKKLGL